uniref:Phospholipase/carboxylesterase/thioesterase domain-containing protein n=1 Tax=Chrysotila carterae TaxID=13221 RepID=A0A7S4EXX9_CHRCT|mmetsp:Transcript_26738/g.58704  ORF Transcript_26738/g.58704 Transcript_26738/m.58704 type:complete len:317 (-) Transcript_26738:139-1089(-)
MSDVDSLSIKDLKSLIEKAGLTYADCLDKSDLRERAREAERLLAASVAKQATPQGGSSSQASSAFVTRKLGGYECLVSAPAEVLNGSSSADFAIIMLHGLGATSRDLTDVGEILLRQALAKKSAVLVFPQAPHDPMMGAAWWTLDAMKFMALSTADEKTVAQAIREEPRGLDKCRAQLSTLLRETRELAGGAGTPLPSKRVLLGGFSQGAMTALDTALNQTNEEQVAGVAFLSGAPIVVEQWASRLKAHRGLRVLVTHGRADMLLPLQCSEWVRDLLQQHGAKVSYHTHAGGHDLGGPDLAKELVAFAEDCLSTPL